MRRIRQFIDLAPILDVVLILLFAFMLNIQNIDLDKSKLVSDLDEQNLFLSASLEEVRSLAKSKGDEILNLETERSMHNFEKETIDHLVKSLSRLIGLRQDEIRSLAMDSSSQSPSHLDDILASLTDTEKIVEELIRLSLTQNKFYIIEIEILTSLNLIYINGQDTGVNIQRDDILDKDRKISKELEIFDLIQRHIEKRDGSASLILINLVLKDIEVRVYAHDLTWNVLLNVQEKYGFDKVFRERRTYF